MSEEIVPALRADADTVRASTRAARLAAEQTVIDLERAQQAHREELARARAELEAQFAARRAELEAQIAPLREQIAQLTEVAWTIDLYLGRDEHIQRLRDGEPAPDGTPITIRQMVLSMAEESIILIGQGGVDYSRIEYWVDWLLAEPGNLDRILPEPKGVVVLVPTRVKSATGNPWEDAGRDKLNGESYWLVRNGERLWLLTVDENLRIGDRLLPKRTEFTEVFEEELFGRKVEPGSQRWLDLEKKADRRRRHYMRIMLVLQGLIDRTEVFAPLPAAGVNLMSVKAQADGHVVLLADGEDSMLLTDGRPSFRDWQRELCARMRPGMRVIGAFDRYAVQDRISPSSALSTPDTGEAYLIEGRRGDGFVIRFQRTDEVWRRNVPVPGRPGYVYRGETLTTPKVRASMTIYPTDSFVLPVDLASKADLDHYLGSRADRSSGFLSMVPVIRAALALKEAEAVLEKPFRDLLADMVDAAGGDRDDVDDLIHQWKVAHTWHRPLNGEPKHEARAARQIVAGVRQRLRAKSSVAQDVVAAARASSDCLAVTQCKDGTFRSYSVSVNAPDAGVLVDITNYTRKGKVVEVRDNQVALARSVASQVVLWQDPRWTTWNTSAVRDHYLSPAERDIAVQAAIEAAEGEGDVVCVTELFGPTNPRDRRMAVYRWNPATAPFAAYRVLTWREHDRNGMRVTEFAVKRTRDGVTVHKPKFRSMPTDYSHYQVEGDVERPWWGGASYREQRPRLVWQDDSATRAMLAFGAQCRALSDELDKVERASRDQDRAIVDATVDALIADGVAAERARFDEDYGPGSEDLWRDRYESQAADTARASVASLSTWLMDAVGAARRNGVDVTGLTVAQVERAAADGGWKGGRGWPVSRAPKGFDDVRVTGPTA